jgi:hypothetical protein
VDGVQGREHRLGVRLLTEGVRRFELLGLAVTSLDGLTQLEVGRELLLELALPGLGILPLEGRFEGPLAERSPLAHGHPDPPRFRSCQRVP